MDLSRHNCSEVNLKDTTVDKKGICITISALAIAGLLWAYWPRVPALHPMDVELVREVLLHVDEADIPASISMNDDHLLDLTLTPSSVEEGNGDWEILVSLVPEGESYTRGHVFPLYHRTPEKSAALQMMKGGKRVSLSPRASKSHSEQLYFYGVMRSTDIHFSGLCRLEVLLFPSPDKLTASGQRQMGKPVCVRRESIQLDVK